MAEIEIADYIIIFKTFLTKKCSATKVGQQKWQKFEAMVSCIVPQFLCLSSYHGCNWTFDKVKALTFVFFRTNKE